MGKLGNLEGGASKPPGKWSFGKKLALGSLIIGVMGVIIAGMGVLLDLHGKIFEPRKNSDPEPYASVVKSPIPITSYSDSDSTTSSPANSGMDPNERMYAGTSEAVPERLVSYVPTREVVKVTLPRSWGGKVSTLDVRVNGKPKSSESSQNPVLVSGDEVSVQPPFPLGRTTVTVEARPHPDSAPTLTTLTFYPLWASAFGIYKELSDFSVSGAADRISEGEAGYHFRAEPGLDVLPEVRSKWTVSSSTNVVLGLRYRFLARNSVLQVVLPGGTEVMIGERGAGLISAKADGKFVSREGKLERRLSAAVSRDASLDQNGNGVLAVHDDGTSLRLYVDDEFRRVSDIPIANRSIDPTVKNISVRCLRGEVLVSGIVLFRPPDGTQVTDASNLVALSHLDRT